MSHKFNSLFEIIGPVMVGPSSSHTAGAVRLGKMARILFGQEPTKVIFYLFGSFADTYKGHGTDVALLGGVLGMTPEHEDIPSSLLLAQEKQIDFKFIPLADEVDHPNTVQIIMYGKDDQRLSITGASIGGGSVKISKYNDLSVDIASGVSTIFIQHHDTPGMISEVASVLSGLNMNISSMKVQRDTKGGNANMVIELDDVNTFAFVEPIKNIVPVQKVVFLPKELSEVQDD